MLMLWVKMMLHGQSHASDKQHGFSKTASTYKAIEKHILFLFVLKILHRARLRPPSRLYDELTPLGLDRTPVSTSSTFSPRNKRTCLRHGVGKPLVLALHSLAAGDLAIAR
jgi:hypothetical protein